MPVAPEEVEDKTEIPEPEPVPTEPPPPPARSPSPAEEVIEAEPLNYIEGVSKPYFHRNIKGTSNGGLLIDILFHKIISECCIFNFFLINSTVVKTISLTKKGVIEEYNEWWDTMGEFKSGRSMNNESSLAGDKHVRVMQI